MTAEAFRATFQNEIDGFLTRTNRRYSVTEDEVAAAILSAARRYLPEELDAVEAGKGKSPATPAYTAIQEMMKSLNSDDLCLALACAKGDDAAWEDFFRDYRGFMVSIARSITQDGIAGEQLADSTFAELYGLREADGARISKFSFYSGRGSLRGWLRAVVYQLSADLHRKAGRLVQPEESDAIERMAVSSVDMNGLENEFGDSRYTTAVSETLQRAIKALDSKERLLLAHYYYDEMTLREIGKLFGVHEATICRWLAKTQKKTRKLVEKYLAKDHGFNKRQISEALAQAAERMDVNVGDYLLKTSRPERKMIESQEPTESAAFSLRLE